MPGKYETPRGKAATDAKRRYYEKTYDRLYPAVKKGKKELYIAAAQAAGKSLKRRLTRRHGRRTRNNRE